MLEALRIAPVRPPIEIAISRQEEVGLLGVKQLDFSRITATRGFLLDNDTLDTIITGGPSYFAIDVTVTGKAAHAGMEPEKGINAIQAAARAIAALTLGRLDHETTANVGIIQGGMIRNGVPDTCTFAAECRSLTHDRGPGGGRHDGRDASAARSRPSAPRSTSRSTTSARRRSSPTMRGP